MQLKSSRLTNISSPHPRWGIYWNIYMTWLPVRQVDIWSDGSCNSSQVDVPTFHPLTLWGIDQNISKTVSRPDYRSDESTFAMTGHDDLSRVKSTCQHFILSCTEAYIEIYKCLETRISRDRSRLLPWQVVQLELSRLTNISSPHPLRNISKYF